MIATEPGKLRMVFKRDPVVSPGSQSISFDNKIITHATYSENNGDAELDVTASQPLTASFSSDRKTITFRQLLFLQFKPHQRQLASQEKASELGLQPDSRIRHNRLLRQATRRRLFIALWLWSIPPTAAKNGARP